MRYIAYRTLFILALTTIHQYSYAEIYFNDGSSRYNSRTVFDFIYGDSFSESNTPFSVNMASTANSATFDYSGRNQAISYEEDIYDNDFNFLGTRSIIESSSDDIFLEVFSNAPILLSLTGSFSLYHDNNSTAQIFGLFGTTSDFIFDFETEFNGLNQTDEFSYEQVLGPGTYIFLLDSGGTFDWQSYTYEFSLTVSEVPVPATILLFSSSIMGLAAFRIKRL